MSFNIELSPLNDVYDVYIKLRVDKNCLHIYFTGNDAKLVDLARDWLILERGFLESMFGYIPNSPNNPGSVQVTQKRKFGLESHGVHLRRSFEYAITPDVFSVYLNCFFEQQQIDRERIGQDFMDQSEMFTIKETYETYYSSYSRSKEEKQFERDRALKKLDKLESKRSTIERSPRALFTNNGLSKFNKSDEQQQLIDDYNSSWTL